MKSVRTFLTGLIDYAGLFPPAQLPLSEAIKNYAAYRQTAVSWMLARFIIPAPQLAALTQLAAPLFSADPGFVFSVLGQGGQTAESFRTTLQTDLQTITRFRQQNEGLVTADVFEVRLPTADLIPETADLLSQHGLRAFFETAVSPQASDYLQKITAQVQAIAAYNQAAQPVLPVGFKLRTGGTEATAFPTAAQIAHALVACRDAGAPFKATAGLHHPIRHFNDSVQTKMHGFLNLFGAGILAHVHQLDVATVQTILEDENPTHFCFSADSFSWCGLVAKTADIHPIRQQFLLSYGSCSFDEPREDLERLGVLPVSS